jgi:uncharacterized protein involved in type VI secretion and phage assembly
VSADGAAPSAWGLEAGGHVKGVAVAVVTQNKDSSGQVCVKVRYPWHSQPTDSYPARIVTPMAGKKRGIYFVPEVDDEVLVVFDKGDLSHPYVIGSLWNGSDSSPQTNSDGKNDVRVIHTRKGHRLLFNDGDKGLVQLELNDGKKLKIDDDGITLEDTGGNKLSIDSKSNALSIEARGTLTLKGATVSVEATGTLNIKGGTVSISGTPVRLN